MFAALVARFLPFKTAAVLVALAALAGFAAVQTVRLGAAQAAARSSADALAWQTRLLETQNAAIESVRAEADRRMLAADKAVAAAKRTSEKAAARAAAVALAPVPADCSGAIGWMVEQGARLEGEQ